MRIAGCRRRAEIRAVAEGLSLAEWKGAGLITASSPGPIGTKEPWIFRRRTCNVRPDVVVCGLSSHPFEAWFAAGAKIQNVQAEYLLLFGRQLGRSVSVRDAGGVTIDALEVRLIEGNPYGSPSRYPSEDRRC